MTRNSNRIYIHILILSIFIPSILYAELPNYYIYRGEPIKLELDTEQLAVVYKAGLSREDHNSIIAEAGLSIADEWATGSPDWYFMTASALLGDAADVNSHIEKLIALPEIEFVSPIFRASENEMAAITPDILVCLKSEYINQALEILIELAPGSEIVDDNFGNMPGAYIIRPAARNGFDVLALSNAIAGDNRIKWSEPDMKCYVRIDEPIYDESISGDIIDSLSRSNEQSRFTPNDPLFDQQWAHRNTGQFGGIPGHDTDADLAWDISTGNPDIKILVLDDGVQLDHPDLNVLPGRDFTDDPGGNLGAPINRCDGHGTIVAGQITAIINNGIGCVGVAPECKVLPARVFISVIISPCTNGNYYSTSWIANAISWGEEQGARISNESWGGPLLQSDAIDDQFLQTYNNGMVHFASAGNANSSGVIYPARLEYVNAVSMLDRFGRMIPGSYGPEMDFSAPGVKVLTTDRTGTDGSNETDYIFASGTSFSSPYAAGVAALILSVYPDLTPPEVEERMRCSATDYWAPGHDIYFGYGVVNAYRAVLPEGLDTDGDGVDDYCDKCPGFDDSIDADNDGQPDLCDACPDDPLNDSNDNDGICGGVDNCPEIYNPNQEDTDGDGIGDLCDIACGDANWDYYINISDISYLISYYFYNGSEPVHFSTGDLNCDDKINLTDIILLNSLLFHNGTDDCCL